MKMPSSHSSNEVAEDEAEVKITTTEGDITRSLNMRSLAVENFWPMQKKLLMACFSL